ncbi:zeta toxin family protein [Pedobacter sp. MC2016-14]|uniref:zeta toxin family protein n=1 Tax=Pedobacter sp. MC2016-14 TaxID=2897327 RepID=UPI00351D224A
MVAQQADFAIETTLATKSYVSLIKQAQALGYRVSLLYFWLSSPKVAIERVAKRVSKGGHHIPSETIELRYHRGISNLYTRYMSICDEWTVVNNMNLIPEVIAKSDSFGKSIINTEIWDTIFKHQ